MKKLLDAESSAGTGTASGIAVAVAEQIGKAVVCAEKAPAETFLKKIKAVVDAEGFSFKKEAEEWGLKEALALLADLEVACGCPDAQAAQ